MKNKFILSLDCEGKWGVADKVSEHHHLELSRDRLESSYKHLLQMLDHYGIPATFAFVGLFRRSLSELHTLDWDDLCNRFPFVHKAHIDIFEGTQEGWDGDWAVRLVRESNRNGLKHEIACHGGTHSPFGDMTESQARADLALCGDLAGQTFIFPRNSISHLHVLKEHGVVGYRAARPGNAATRIFDEMNIFQKGEATTDPSSFRKIPAGFFINWKSGLRRRIPVCLSALRFEKMLTSGPVTNQVIHFWSHPENLASAPETFDVLESLLKQASVARERGHLEVCTQIDYSKGL